MRQMHTGLCDKRTVSCKLHDTDPEGGFVPNQATAVKVDKEDEHEVEPSARRPNVHSGGSATWSGAGRSVLLKFEASTK